MKIALSCDHAGFQLKQHLHKYLEAAGFDIVDLGVDTDAVSTDYPDAAEAIGKAVSAHEVDRGILICGSGVGASIAANKMHGVYAGLCHDTYSAAQGVEHDNMNILCLGGRVVGVNLAEKLVDAFLGARFDADSERFVRRFGKVKKIENGG